jgi:hypothetical protein
MLDGGNIGLPAFNLVPSPHPDDKDYYKSVGENWYKREAINDDTQLHEEYCAMKEAKR